MFNKNEVILETFHSLANTIESLKQENNMLRTSYNNARKDIKEYENKKYSNHYIVVFAVDDPIELYIKSDINRPNNPTDDDIIKNYILDNYGVNKKYTIIQIGMNTIEYL